MKVGDDENGDNNGVETVDETTKKKVNGYIIAVMVNYGRKYYYKKGKKDSKWTWYDTYGNVVRTELY